MELLSNLKIIDAIDFILVVLLLYYVYTLVRGTVAINIFIGIIIVYLIWELTKFLEMKVLSNIFGSFMSVGFFALIVLFQQEIRKFLLMIGSTSFTRRKKIIRRFKFIKQPLEPDFNVDVILSVCQKMGNTKTGAILVLERNNNLEAVKSTGDKMNIEVKAPIIESIFFKNSPLHDGAIIIKNNYIVATRVILPVSDKKNIPFRFGLRHRAAVGITEDTDALALVVSEETGQISYIKNGDFVFFKTLGDLKNKIEEDMS